MIHEIKKNPKPIQQNETQPDLQSFYFTYRLYFGRGTEKEKQQMIIDMLLEKKCFQEENEIISKLQPILDKYITLIDDLGALHILMARYISLHDICMAHYEPSETPHIIAIPTIQRDTSIRERVNGIEVQIHSIKLDQITIEEDLYFIEHLIRISAKEHKKTVFLDELSAFFQYPKDKVIAHLNILSSTYPDILQCRNIICRLSDHAYRYNDSDEWFI